MPIDETKMRLDQIARNLCKPLGCRVVSCLKANRPGGCGGEMAALTQCLEQKREQIDLALKQGRSLSTVERVSLNCDD